jgi:hypothetical protein
LFHEIDMNSISQVMLHYEWANRTTGEIYEVTANIVASNFQWTKKYGSTRFRGNTYRNKKLEATEADECIVVDDNEYSKDIGSDDDDEEFTASRNFEFLRTNPTRNTKANQDEDEERSSDAKRKSYSPALSANKKMKSQGNHEKTKPGADLDRKMPVAQLPLANVMYNKAQEQDDWKKDIHEMSKAIKGLVEAQVKTNEKMLKLEKQFAKEDKDKEDKEDDVEDEMKNTPEKKNNL